MSHTDDMSTSFANEYTHHPPVTAMGEQPDATAAVPHATVNGDKQNSGRDDVTVIGTGHEKGGDMLQPNHLSAGAAVLEQSTLIPMTGERKMTKKSEVFSYCLMYIALTGLGPFNYMPAQLQNLLTQQFPDGFLQWGGQQTSISSLILDLNGIQFAIQTVLLLMIGPYADYGTWRPWLLILFTIISWGVGFGWLGLENPVSWNSACGLYVVATVAFNLANTFYFAAFPSLVRNRPHMIAAEHEVASGQMSPESYADLDMRERSKISNYSLATSAAGSCCILVLGLVVPFTVGVETMEQNTRVYSILIAYFTAVWIIFALPWFLTEQYRPGQKLPKGVSYLTIGPKQLWQAVREISKLRYTFLYLLAFFMLNDVYTVLGLSVNLLQNDAIDFDTKQFTYLFILAFGAQAIGAFGIAMAQRWLGFSAKTGCLFGAFWMVVQCLWGLVVWEFYMFQGWTGVLTAGWNTYSNTMISEVVPAPKMYLFFSLFFIVGKTSSFVGPFIASAIINDADGNTSASFWWTFFSGVVGLALLALVDVKKAKVACAEYLEKEASRDYANFDAAQGQDGATQFEKAMAGRAVMQPVH